MTLLKILLPLGILSLVCAQFPRKCINRADLLGRVCCPIGEDGTMCNNGTMKGVCSSFTQFHYYIGKPEIQSRVNRDDRGHWPSHFFNHLCTCQGNFGGPDCGRCEPGYEGKNCDVKSPLKSKMQLFGSLFQSYKVPLLTKWLTKISLGLFFPRF